jgi:hypothetical protein
MAQSPSNKSNIGRLFKNGDILLIARLVRDHFGHDPAHSSVSAGRFPGHQHRPFAADPAFHPLCKGTGRFHGLSNPALVRHPLQAFAQYCLHPPDSAGWLRGAYHRNVRQLRRPRQLRRRFGHLPHLGPHQFHRHHQGSGAHRGGRRALHFGRHARQANGHRRRTERRHDQRNRGPRPPPQDRARSRLLRRYGRRQQIRPRRRHSRHSHHLDQRPGRFCHRHPPKRA